MSPTCSRYIEKHHLDLSNLPPKQTCGVGSNPEKVMNHSIQKSFSRDFPILFHQRIVKECQKLHRATAHCSFCVSVLLKPGQNPTKVEHFNGQEWEALRGERIMGIMGVHHVHPATSKLTLGQVSN